MRINADNIMLNGGASTVELSNDETMSLTLVYHDKNRPIFYTYIVFFFQVWFGTNEYLGPSQQRWWEVARTTH